MLAIAAAVIFAIAFLLSATTTATNAVFSPTSLLLACACRKPRPRSCDQAIFVDQATDASVSSDAVLVEIDRVRQRCQRRGAVQRAVRPVLVVVDLVLVQDPPQMVLVPD